MITETRWERRIRRADALEAKWPFAAEVLRFFRAVTAFQKEVHARFPAFVIANLKSADLQSSAPVLFDSLAPFIPGLLDLVAREAPPALAGAAREARGWNREPWARAVGDFLSASPWGGRALPGPTNAVGPPAGGEPTAFFARVLLQPSLGMLCNHKSEIPNHKSSAPLRACPCCGHPPVAGVLRENPEAQAVTRTLVCSMCATEWPYPRVLCPGCGEERPEKLPRYAAEEIPWVRVEACDACRRYLKAVDLTRDAEAEPLTDEIGSTPLDCLAAERGYAKLTPNLLGI